MAISGGNSCCVCVPTSATCFVIEMWGQGGAGASGCCCGVGSYGGQGGSYGWVTCTTSATNHILCACACTCNCAYGLCQGTSGQFSKVTQCNSPSNVWCVSGGSGGYWCCNPSSPWCWEGSSNVSAGSNKYNTWLFFRCNSAALAGQSSTASSGTALQTCCSSAGSITPNAATFSGCASQPFTGGSANLHTSTLLWPCLCLCACFNSPYVWVGGCGWSDPASTSSPFGSYNNVGSGVVNGFFCGGGSGVGGASYAGGDQAWHQGFFGCGGCYPQNGNSPGGGGMSPHTQTAVSCGGCGGYGLILISWC